MKYIKFICLLMALLSLVSCTSSSEEYAQYLDEKHDVIIYDDNKYILVPDCDISARSFDDPSGNSLNLIDHDENKPKWGHDFSGDFVFFSDNKTILYRPATDDETAKYYFREDKYDAYVDMINGEEPPAFYLDAYIRDGYDLSSYHGSVTNVNDDEFFKVISDTIFYPEVVIPYDEYSMSENFMHEGIVYGGETDWEFYSSAYPLYYSDTYGFGIAVDDGNDLNFHLIPREYEEEIRATFYSEDGRFESETEDLSVSP